MARAIPGLGSGGARPERREGLRMTGSAQERRHASIATPSSPSSPPSLRPAPPPAGRLSSPRLFVGSPSSARPSARKEIHSDRRKHSRPRGAGGPGVDRAAPRRDTRCGGMAKHQRDPRARHGRGGGGAVRPSWNADGVGAGRVRAVAPIPAARSAASRLARPRPLRAVLRPRLHAAIRAAVSLRLRAFARRHQGLPAVGLEDAGPSRARAHARRRDNHRPAGAGRGERRRHGHCRAIPRRAFQSVGAPDRGPPDLGVRERRRPDGRRLARGRVARRTPAASASSPSSTTTTTSPSTATRRSPFPRTCSAGSRATAGMSSAWTTATISRPHRRPRGCRRGDRAADASSSSGPSSPIRRPPSATAPRPTASPWAPTRSGGPRRSWAGRTSPVLRAGGRARPLAGGGAARRRAGGGLARAARALRGRRPRAAGELGHWLEGVLPEGWDRGAPRAHAGRRAAGHAAGVGPRTPGDRGRRSQPGRRLRRPRRQHRHHTQAGRSIRAEHDAAAPFTGASASTAWPRSSTVSRPTAGSAGSAAPSWSSPTT